MAIANILKHSGYVQFAEPDYLVAPSIEPNDSGYSSQWHHQTINSPQAWDVTTGSHNVLVGVCDSGFDEDHPDLAANLRLDLAFNAQDGSNYIADFSGHGTGTAGTLGAVGNNNLGYAGVNWDVDIIPVRIAISDTNSSAYISTMATCIEYAADQGARVVNLSYGGIQYSTIDSAAQYLRSKNGLLFMSAGNDGREFPDYPDYTSFIGVGATESSNNRASFSSWGDYVDLTAPGVGIRTTYKDGGYVSYSGTSFSSPMTAGVAALMVAANPNITPDEIEQGLFSTATDIGAAGDDVVFGHGLINAQAAVNYAQNLGQFSAPVAIITANQDSLPFGNEFVFDAAASSDADGNIVAYQWNLGDGTTSNQASISHNYAAAGAYQVSLTVTDNDGLSDSASVWVQVTNELPLASAQADITSGFAPLSVNFSGNGSSDSDGTIVTYAWDFGDNNQASGSTTNHIYTTPGNYQATLTVTDNAGATNSTSISIQVFDANEVIAPDGLNATVNEQTVTLTWQDNSINETAFVVERAMKIRGKYNFETIDTLAANSTEFVDENVALGNYQYRVIAKNSVTSSASDTIQVSVDTVSTEPPPDPEPSTLAAPSNFSASTNGDVVNFSWSDNSTAETGFVIEQLEKNKGTLTLLKEIDVPAGSTSASFTQGAGTYSYRIKAVKDSESSDYSEVINVRIR